jgi:predicted nucleotidyltransferase
MVEDVHDKAVSHLLSNCRDLSVVSILAYGSYARGDYRPNSDVDLLVVLDSERYSSADLRRLVEVAEAGRERFGISLNMDIMLDSEIDLWNRGILLEGHSFIDLSFYRRDGKILLGEDIRDRFRLPPDLEEKAKVLLGIIESEFKRWLLESRGERLVPHWITGWLLVTFLNTLGIAEATSFQETCQLVEGIPYLASTPEFEKYKEKKELTPDEFINLNRIIKSYSQKM